MHVIEARRLDQEPALALTFASVGPRMVLNAVGEIDLMTAPVVSEVAGCALSAGAQELWIDLTRVEFIDVAGVHTLLDLAALASEEERSFAVITSGGPVRRAFDVTGAAARMRVFDSRSNVHRLW
jgi:anti-sigma B factor antagonist